MYSRYPVTLLPDRPAPSATDCQLKAILVLVLSKLSRTGTDGYEGTLVTAEIRSVLNFPWPILLDALNLNRYI